MMYVAIAGLGPDARNDAEHLRQTTSGFGLELAARHTGFRIGFEYAQRLAKGAERDAKKKKGSK
jgi:hypothetical protein